MVSALIPLVALVVVAIAIPICFVLYRRLKRNKHDPEADDEQALETVPRSRDTSSSMTILLQSGKGPGPISFDPTVAQPGPPYAVQYPNQAYTTPTKNKSSETRRVAMRVNNPEGFRHKSKLAPKGVVFDEFNGTIYELHINSVASDGVKFDAALVDPEWHCYNRNDPLYKACDVYYLCESYAPWRDYTSLMRCN